MADPKLTDWFNGARKPVIPGVYERARTPAFPEHYSYFNGKEWGLTAVTPELAEARQKLISVWQNIKWRGLAEQPKELSNV